MIDGKHGYTLLLLISILHCVHGTDTSTGIPKVAATVLVILGCVVTAVVVSALVNCCCEKKDVKDDASDISDNTKKLIKARLAIIQMQRRRELQKSTLKIFRLWSKKSKSPRASPKLSASKSDEHSVVVDLEEEPEKDNISGSINSNNGSKSTFLKGNKVANGTSNISPSVAPSSPRLSASVFSSKKGANSSKASSPASSIKSYASSFVSSSTESKQEMTSSSASAKSSPSKNSSVAANTKTPKNAGTNKKKSVTFNEKVEIQQTD